MNTRTIFAFCAVGALVLILGLANLWFVSRANSVAAESVKQITSMDSRIRKLEASLPKPDRRTSAAVAEDVATLRASLDLISKQLTDFVNRSGNDHEPETPKEDVDIREGEEKR